MRAQIHQQYYYSTKGHLFQKDFLMSYIFQKTNEKFDKFLP